LSELSEPKQKLSIWDKIGHFFSQQPLFESAFQVSSNYFSGIRLNPKEKSVGSHFFLTLEEGVVTPSFFKNNIKDPRALAERVRTRVENLNLSSHNVAFLLPEQAQRSFILTFESIPSSPQEREQVILFRIRKQMPLLPEDVRLSYSVIRSNAKGRILATIARTSVIKEYEDAFGQLHLKIRTIGVPFLSLSYLLRKEKERDLLLVNVEKDSLSLLAFVDAEIYLYRQKSFVVEDPEKTMNFGIHNIIQEISNTGHFIEDREKRQIASLWLRLGAVKDAPSMMAEIESKSPYPLKNIASLIGSNFRSENRAIYSPLIGQLL